MKINKLILIFVCLLLCGFKSGALTQGPLKPAAKKAIAAFFTEKDFNSFFPLRNSFYTYKAFISAIDELAAVKIKVEKRGSYLYRLTRTDAKTGQSKVISKDDDWDEPSAQKLPYGTYDILYADFCSEKDPETNKKELAAFLAQIAHETRHGENGKYNDGLMYLHEVDTSLQYVAENDNYPPVKGKKYYGRGPMQLSYNGNYGYASACILGDKTILLNNPGLVSSNAVVAFETAIYFWMTPQPPKPSAHDVMSGNWKPTATDEAKGRVPGFGMTINVINGEVECNKGDGNLNMSDRIGYYQNFLKQMMVTDPDCKCSCGKMQPYQ